MTKKSILALLLSLLLSFPPSTLYLLPSPASILGSTTEIYLPQGEDIPSSTPNTISIDGGTLELVLDNSLKLEVGSLKFEKEKDIYLTIRYSAFKDEIDFYFHGRKWGSVNLKDKDFDVGEMINDLREKYKAGLITYFKNRYAPLKGRDIKKNYKRVYNGLEVLKSGSPDVQFGGQDVPTSGPASGLQDTNTSGLQSHLSQYTVSTTNQVLWLDAANIDNAGNTADSSDTTTTWTDRSGNSNNGTLTNFTLPSDANGGWKGSNTVSSPSQLHFDGTNDYVETMTSSDFAFGTGDFTLAIWIKPDDFGGYTHLFAFNGNQNTGAFKANVGGGANPGALYWYDSSFSTWDTFKNAVLVANSWNHAVLVRRSNVAEIYLNGDLKGTASGFNINYTGTPFIRIGNGWSNEYTDGSIANARIYSSALTAEQIRQNYLAEAYKFQGTDNVAPGVYGDEDLRGVAYKKAGDTFDLYIEDVNPVTNGDNDVSAINTVSCMLGSTSLTNPTPTEENFTSGVDFDGSNDYINLGTSDSLRPGTGNFSVSTLIMINNNSGWDSIVGDRNSAGIGTAEGWVVSLTDTGVFSVILEDSSNNAKYYKSSTAYDDNKWHDLTFTWNGSADILKMYVDGSEITPTKINDAALGDISPATNINIGRQPNNANYTGGSIASVRIYNRVLTASEIARNNRFRYEPSDPHGLVAWYKLNDDNVGTNTATTAAAYKWDTSTNSIVADPNLNGTLTNFSFGGADGWINQYSYNRNKYTYSVPTLSGSNQVEKLQCTVTDDWGNSTSANEEVGGIFVSRAPNVTTTVSNSTTLMTGDTIPVTVTDTTPDTSILSSPTTPSANIDGNNFSTTCDITPATLTKAISFDGVDDYVSVGNVYNGVKTIAFWVNPSTNSQNIIDLNGTAYISATSGTISATGFTSPTIYVNGSVSSTLTASTWQHVTIVTSTGLNASAFNLGKISTNYLSGSLDDVQVYSRELSPDEISYIKNNPGKPFNSRGLVGHWTFGQLEDIDSDGSTDDVRDLSGSGNHGTLTNYADLSAALIDSTVTNAIDGRTGSCNISVTNSDPSGPSNVTDKTLTISASNSLSQSGNVTRTVSLSRNQNPPAPTISSATIAGASAGTGGTYSVNYNEALVINFTSTDPDSSDTVTLSTPTSPAVGTFTAGMAANPGTGTFTFTPGLSHLGMSYNFTVRATDNNSATSASDLTVTINVGSNAPPDSPTISSSTIDGASAGTGGSYTITDGQVLVVNFTASDSNSSDTVTLSTPTSPTRGTFTAASAANPGTATFTFTPTADHVNNTYTFTVRATDSNSAASDSDLSISIKVNPTQAALDLINSGIIEIEQSLMGGNSGESSTTSPTIIVAPPPPPAPPRPLGDSSASPQNDNKGPQGDPSKPKAPQDKPQDPKTTGPTSGPPDINTSGPQDINTSGPQDINTSGPEEDDGIPEITIAEFPEIPDILKNPKNPKKGPKKPKGDKETTDSGQETTEGGPQTTEGGPQTTEGDSSASPQNDNKPKDKPDKDKGQEQQTNVVIAGSPTSFALPPDAAVVDELRNTPQVFSELDISVVITDSKGVEHTVPASILVGAGKDDNSPLVINTDTLPENLPSGAATLSLLVNGKAKAKINIIVSESQFKTGEDDEFGTLRPIITKVSAKRKKNKLILRIIGDNYYNKKLDVNENVIHTKDRLTQITMLPNDSVKRLAWKINKNGKVIIAKYKLLKKDLSGKMTITVTNPFGQAISTFEMPE